MKREMIRILSSWDDVGESINSLRAFNLPLHSDPTKNWDLNNISSTLDGIAKDGAILDMGCGDGSALKLCRAKGFGNLVGIDLRLAWTERLSQLYHVLKERRRVLSLVKGDLTSTRFRDGSFDFVICLSVIEHGVDVGRFLSEAARLLVNGGLLYLSTDYHEPKIFVESELRPWGFPWTIFSRKEITQILSEAREQNLLLVGNGEVSRGISEEIVYNHGKKYTFISLLFKKLAYEGQSHH